MTGFGLYSLATKQPKKSLPCYSMGVVAVVAVGLSLPHHHHRCCCLHYHHWGSIIIAAAVVMSSLRRPSNHRCHRSSCRDDGGGDDRLRLWPDTRGLRIHSYSAILFLLLVTCGSSGSQDQPLQQQLEEQPLSSSKSLSRQPRSASNEFGKSAIFSVNFGNW